MPFAARFVSILDRGERGLPISEGSLHHLGLDQVLAALHVDDEAMEALRTPLLHADDVRYRQDVFRDLDDTGVRDALADLAEASRRAAAHRTASARVRQAALRDRRHLTAAAAYVRALDAATGALAPVRSEALRLLRDHLTALAASDRVQDLRDRSARLEQRWSAVRFALLLQPGRVVVAPFDDEPDLDAEVEAAMAPLGPPPERARPASAARTGLLGDGLGSVAEWVLDAVTRIEPDLFADLAAFRRDHEEFLDPALERFARELPFFLEVRRLAEELRTTGVSVVLPTVLDEDRRVLLHDFVDPALALRLRAEDRRPVGNDLELAADERIVVVSGPNQGGKSTAARAFGQILHLAAIGCPVPAAVATLPLVDQVLTLFPHEERLDSLAGGLGEEVERMHAALAHASRRSALVLNETFASTTAADAELLLTEVLHRIEAIGALALCVTFLDEIADLGGPVVSVVAEVDASDTSVRTFTLARRPADGRAYVRSLAARHGLTGSAIRARVAEAAR